MIDIKRLAGYKLTPEYIAGFFDGEGSIGVYRVGGKRTNKHLRLTVMLTQKDPTILGYIAIKFPPSELYQNGNYFIMKYRNETCIKFLEHIKDYSITKHSQILMALEFLSITSYSEQIRLADALKSEKIVTIN